MVWSSVEVVNWQAFRKPSYTTYLDDSFTVALQTAATLVSCYRGAA